MRSLTGSLVPRSTRAVKKHCYWFCPTALVFHSSARFLDIPYGDCFTVEERWVVRRQESKEGTASSSSGLEMQMMMEVKFSKPCRLQGWITSATNKKVAKGFNDWIAAAKAHLVAHPLGDNNNAPAGGGGGGDGSGGGGGGAADGSSVSAPAVGVGANAGVEAMAVSGGGHGGHGGGQSWYQAVSMVVLILLLAMIWFVMTELVAELRGMRRLMELQQTQQGAALGAGLGTAAGQTAAGQCGPPQV